MNILDRILHVPKQIFLGFYGLFLRVRVFDHGKSLGAGPAIFVFNHTTGSDPIVAQIALRRRIFFMADGRHFSTAFGNFFMTRITDSIPVFKEKGARNIPSFKGMLELLRKGQAIGVFPEGELRKRLSTIELADGAAYLSLRSGIPLTPVYIHNIAPGPHPDSLLGRSDSWEALASIVANVFRKIELHVGDPIFPDHPHPSARDRRAIELINKKILSELDRLSEIARQGSFGRTNDGDRGS
ncbi:1-acyl-sn-glycerol-3-phosphate acyltransferase [Candidatus Hakubella thermalkaliphila]|uniref:1-acyl-sn-glycerol-3-phosphate acyltransferase n=2 Tax=Candidatus Hakubella thermalkaliphila TaxID=2754717 RepID=A0A6V8QB90_9ACTN|nr:lysophospholipid acyltransferase family protein [Candidatus Hakubella thermalkaliphila]MBT9169182.1 Bifunctional protein Aas [Bacillota bacterium]GFP26602.1 1-acyl-sn-glycerol-3-phosphate acyltransferase [Candidatus Hakubella thermalkaliphila]GFP34602.1 1-acyl-sn-glycerol-3-phosphate acyltransferase [Candidatus Hakubella thermalkaliphila]GFP42039.1 1-acyl-sn-glycerol-3-phosphate acyltransferase [Candidatus Hakubella thermalkaliphila]